MLHEYDCLIAPVMTEKAMSSSKDGVHVFHVHGCATKYDIKKAVEKVFAVSVEKVTVQNRKGKKRVFRGKLGKTQAKKLAVVRLSKGTISFEGGF
ncbi:MAG: 50S ribosomal protein L23 [Holosporaceae bacterium]|jgi:large subunit ribosomal protein L23|nr:50S ribosomal protein L23 [Holosporaceae bacterium]